MTKHKEYMLHSLSHRIVTATNTNISKKNTKNQRSTWESEAISLAKSRRYKNKMDICWAIKRRIDLEEGRSFTAGYICCSIKISATSLKEIIRNGKTMKN